jgi:hypothetical protein
MCSSQALWPLQTADLNQAGTTLHAGVLAHNTELTLLHVCADRALRTLLAWMATEAQKEKQATDATETDNICVFTSTTLHAQVSPLEGVCLAARQAGIHVHFVFCDREQQAQSPHLSAAYMDAVAAAAACKCSVSQLTTGADLGATAWLHGSSLQRASRVLAQCLMSSFPKSARQAWAC